MGQLGTSDSLRYFAKRLLTTIENKCTPERCQICLMKEDCDIEKLKIELNNLIYGSKT